MDVINYQATGTAVALVAYVKGRAARARIGRYRECSTRRALDARTRISPAFIVKWIKRALTDTQARTWYYRIRIHYEYVAFMKLSSSLPPSPPPLTPDIFEIFMNARGAGVV